ncbi:MAG: hypothetical protein NC923_06710 [Candidatus Omnitrophica bacterium]|nr:hypothetical protein [Candidatus Omnitrophota bacterium]
MDKKDIYEHLAKIYLDASSKRKKKAQIHRNFRNPVFISVAIAIFLTFVLSANLKRRNFNPETALVLFSDVAKINFHFDPVKKENLSLDLNGLNLTGYKILAFSAKTANPKNKIRMRIELTNSYQEKSEVYLDYLPGHWKEYRIKLASLRNITDWSNLRILAFITEEWNVQDKKGIVYIDNVRFIK